MNRWHGYDPTSRQSQQKDHQEPDEASTHAPILNHLKEYVVLVGRAGSAIADIGVEKREATYRLRPFSKH